MVLPPEERDLFSVSSLPSRVSSTLGLHAVTEDAEATHTDGLAQTKVLIKPLVK